MRSSGNRSRLGSYPDDPGKLAEFCAASPGSCSVDAGLASGVKGGYLFSFLEEGNVYKIEVEPAHPALQGRSL